MAYRDPHVHANESAENIQMVSTSLHLLHVDLIAWKE